MIETQSCASKKVAEHNFLSTWSNLNNSPFHYNFTSCQAIWQAGFDPRSGNIEDMKNGTCGVFSLVLSVNGRVQGKASRAVLPLTPAQHSLRK